MKVFKWVISCSIGFCSFAAVLISGLYYELDIRTVILRSFLALIVGLLLGFLVFSELGIFIIMRDNGPKKKDIDNGIKEHQSKVE